MNDETIYSVDDSRERIVAWLESHDNIMRKQKVQWHSLIDLYDSVPLCGIPENHQVDLYFEEQEWEIDFAERQDRANRNDVERHLRRLEAHNHYLCKPDSWRWRSGEYPKVYGDTVSYSPAYLGMVEPSVPNAAQMERELEDVD